MKKLFLFSILKCLFVGNLLSQTYSGAFINADALQGSGGSSFNINSSSLLQQLSTGSQLMAYITIFKATKSKQYLDQFIIQSKRIQNRRDDDVGYFINEIQNGSTCSVLEDLPSNSESKGWSTDMNDPNHPCLYWLARVNHTAGLIYPMAEFVYMLRTDPNAMTLLLEPLPEEVKNSARLGSDCQQVLNTYQDYANWLRCRVNQSIQFHNANWCSDLGLYKTFPSDVDPCDNEDDFSGEDAPNMQCVMGRTLVKMYLVETLPGGNVGFANQYINKINLIAYNQRQLIDVTPQVDFYTWCHGREDCTVLEDINHANALIDFADLCYQHGLTGYFNYNDMVKFSNTVANKIYKEPLKFNMNTFGTNMYTYDTTLFFYPENFYNRIANYLEMAKYNPYIYNIASDYYSSFALGQEQIGSDKYVEQMTAFSMLALNQGLLNPVAVKRNSQSNKQWKGSAGGDFDGNGTQEFVTLNSLDGNMVIYGLSSTNIITTELTKSGLSQLTKVAAGDIISSHVGDEIIGLNPTNHSLLVYGVDNTTITFLLPFSVNTTSTLTDVEVGDVLASNPGNEIVISTSGGDILFFKYDNTLNEIVSIPYVWQNPIVLSSDVEIGNFIEDNAGLELAVINQSSGNTELQIFNLNDGNANLASYYTGNYNTVITSGDFDGDNIKEIVAFNSFDGQMQFLKYKNNSIAQVAEEYFKPDQAISSLTSFYSPNDNSKASLVVMRDFDGQINVFNAEGLCTGFTLNNQTISEITTIDNGFTGVDNQYTLDYHAHSKLTASNFVIEGDGSSVEFTAGQEIVLLPGFSAKAGSEFHAYIDESLSCGQTVLRQSNPVKNKKGGVALNLQEKKENKLDLQRVNFAIVHPNPSDGDFFIEFVEETKCDFYVLDLMGRKILSGNLNERITIVDLSSIQKGMYTLVLIKEDKKQIEKIVIQ